MSANRYYDEVAVVLGLHICGLGVVRSLACDPNIRILGVGKESAVGKYSQYFDEVFTYLTDDYEEKLHILQQINAKYNVVIPFPAGHDFWVNLLWQERKSLENFIIDYNETVVKLMDKSYQMKIARELEVPYPESLTVVKSNDLDKVEEFKFPIIVKPVERNRSHQVFRLKTFHTYIQFYRTIHKYLGQVSFIVSKMITGPDSSIYSYGSYAKDGNIIQDFTGRKLTQKPSHFGVAGLAETVQNHGVIREYSQRIIRKTIFSGISQIEFKKDRKTGIYYLMEVNPRSW